jgi:hypothetical protein
MGRASLDARMASHRILAALLAVSAAGCASTQKMRIDCVPQKVTVYVDGRQLEGNEAELSTDRPHKIYAKGPGYQPRLVVVEPETGPDGRSAFPSDNVCVEVVPVAVGREIEIDPERDVEVENPGQ